jgi:SAM-dependent methyltransferase
VRFAPLATTGRALDIAAGTGRNATYLAGKGFLVDALDISEVGLRKTVGRFENLRPVCVDLDTYDIARDTYDLIIDINYLQRRLFPQIIEGLKPGGVLIFETFVIGHPSGGQRPHCRDYLLRPNELLRAFLPLHIYYYREIEEEQNHVASLVGVKR